MEWKQGEFLISDQSEDLDISTIHNYLRESYWAKGITRKVVEKSIQHSICFGLYHSSKQVGFGRVITDQATFAYITDVFILSKYRGQGLGKWLIACVLSHPELQRMRRWLLATLDAHKLYDKVGFASLQKPEWFMEIYKPEIYQDTV